VTVAAALSEHPIPVEATGEVIGAVLERVGPGPSLGVLFVSGHHTGAFEDMARAVWEALGPAALIGATAVSVVGGAREVEERPAVSLWAAQSGTASATSIGATPTPDDSWQFTGPAPDELADASTVLLLADPASFPVTELLRELDRDHPHLRVIGGLASAGTSPGANRLTVDGRTLGGGAAAILLGADSGVDAVVSQGCRPVGSPLTVTRAERNVIYEIAGRPALDQLQALLESLEPDELAMARGGLHIGRVIDEHKAEFGRGDFLIRSVLGADRAVGALAVGDEVHIGDTVQFQVRDARSADEDLRTLLVNRRAAGALVFTCNGRGMRLFGRPDHDAEVVAESIASTSVAGMFCAGEVGPVGGRSFLHGFTASVALFGASVGEGSLG
jgi:small ligand-binding sensory domain FIST